MKYTYPRDFQSSNLRRSEARTPGPRRRSQATVKRGPSRTEDEETQELARNGEDPRPTRKLRRDPAPLGRLRSPEALVLLLALVSLVILVPLRGILSPVPAVLFLATLTLFLIPGFLISRLAPEESFSDVGWLPVSFALSTGVFGLAAVPFLVLQRGFGEYLWACGALLAASLVLAAFGFLGGKTREKPAYEAREDPSAFTRLMWVPFLGVGAVLAYASSRVVPEPNEDHWAYLSYIQEYLNAENLGSINPFYGTEVQGFSRLMINGWLTIQAAFARVSGIGPVDLASTYLTPALVLVSLLAFYWLARMLFESRGAALLAGSLYGLFLLFYLDSTPSSFGGNLVRRALEDKFAARYLLLPVALGLAVLFLKKRGWLKLGMFALVFLATGVVHPMVMGILGLGVAAFGAVHLAVNPRNRGAWTGVLALGAVVFLALVPPVVYLLITGSPLLSRLEVLDPALVENRSRVWQDQKRLLILGEGSYIMHPSLVLNPVISASYLVGVPFLIWRVGRSLAAQLLLGTLLAFALLVYFPPLSSLAGEFVRPWLIYRLAWPIPLAALLTVGWMLWELLGYANRRFEGLASVRGPVPLLALVLVVLLAAAAAPRALAGVRTINSVDEPQLDAASCVDPAFDRMQEVVETRSVVLTPALENSCVPAYSSLTDVISYRYQFLEESGSGENATSRRAQTVQDFFDASTLSPAMIETLQSYEADYVLLPTGSPLNIQLRHLPGFTALDTPGERYQLYGVNWEKLFVTQAVSANGALQSDDPYTAIDAYNAALAGDPNEAVLAYTGLGLSYDTLDSPLEAAAYYEQAIDLAPQEPSLYDLLSGTYNGTGEYPYSAQALQSGIDRISEDVGLRIRLSSLLTFRNTRVAIETQRTVVEQFPEVPSYHIELGKLLAISGEGAAANRQFRRAIRQNPLSPSLHAEVALANQLADRDRAALRYYEQALELEPDSPQYNLNVGKTYAGLSTEDGRNEEYFLLAERYLERAAELPSRPGRMDVRDFAWSSLGDLYNSWDREERAIEAYEKSLEMDPEQPQVRQKLEELRQAR